MLTSLPKGVGVALATIFHPDGSVDIQSTIQCAQRCIDAGCTSVLIGGTTGEPWRMTARDRIELAGAIKSVNSETFIFVGTGDVDAVRGLAITAEVARARVADALLVLSSAELPVSEHYARIVEAADECPVLGYHFPLMSPPGITTDEMATLPIAGLKDSSGSADRLATLLTDGHLVYVGSSNLLLLAGQCGGHGALVSLANIEPRLCLEAWAGDPQAQKQLFSCHLESLRNFPAALKPEGFRH
jgi:4-hydroxy-tetrahydrodipicolinate synthase